MMIRILALAGPALMTATVGLSAAMACPGDVLVGPPPVVEDGDAAAPAMPDGAFAAGVAAIDGGDYHHAIEHFMTVVGREPDNVEAYNYLGYAHRKLQNFLPSLQYYTRALELDPDHTGAHAYIGETYLELGNLKKAEQHLAQLDLLCLFGCDHFYALQEKVELYRANYSG